MTKLHARTWLLLGALAVPAHVFAQPALISREPYRKWDAGGVFEINWGESAGWSADLGRYWSPHLKTSLAISTPDEGYHGGEVCSFGRSTMTCTYHTPRPPVAATVAYQFYENVFVHPYVAASLAMSPFESIETTYAQPLYRPVSTRSLGTAIDTRAILAGGFKSYFDNGRAFMRSELGVSVGRGGPAYAVVRIGAGVDF